MKLLPFILFAVLFLGCLSPQQITIKDAPVPGYKIYENKAEGISFQFPSSWTVKENPDAMIFLNGPVSSFAIVLFNQNPGDSYSIMADDKAAELRVDPESFNIEQNNILVGGALASEIITDSGPQGKDSELQNVITTETTYVNDPINNRVVYIIFSLPATNYQAHADEISRIYQTFIWSKKE